jgi:7,8-dihydropterin-6-yl-methyl-4-(beta-D-ribofuranosyl)aminobenzene 5'-phosphate synthase
MKITVLAENSVCKSNFLNLEAANGLSLFIEFDERKILFETGQSDLFIHNAREMGIDLSQVDYLVISPGHFDHRGGLKHFQKINTRAKVFLHIYAAPYFGGPDKKTFAQNRRIYFIDQDTQIEDKIILLNGFTENSPKPQSAKVLYEKTENRVTADKINRELTMLLIENNEIVLFSGCSHSEIINIIDEVRLFSKTMKIKATFSGSNIHKQKINTGDVIVI